MARPILFAFLLLICIPFPAQAQESLPDIGTFTAEFEKSEGFYTIYWDEDAGKVWLEIASFGEQFLYLVSLPAGLGSNDIGLDRGQLGGYQIVEFHRVGPKVLLVAPNMDYRSTSTNPAEVKAVEDAFARSVLWGFKIAAQSGDRVLVDATDFIVRDTQRIALRLSGSGQGNFRVDDSRSTPNPEVLKSFPDNTEMEAWLTFTGDNPGGYVRSVAADPTTFTLGVRHSFIRLPDDGYTPRKADPRYGYGTTSFADYSAAIGEPIVQRYIRRHRLEKINPGPEPSRVKEPIVYYLDPGTPEPVRSALLDGARWWADAFEAAGFIDAYRVEVLPEGADMMDVRYNTIQWVHRSTRGWSYGSSVVDPRTGEIMKGHVTLGSLRVRQDYLIAEGLLGPYAEEDAGPSNAALEMALARIRQLSAHEVGHTLGISHNFAASAYGRESVMDYPAPLATVTVDGDIDISDAYDTGMGEWDLRSIAYGYGDWGADTEARLDSLLQDAAANGLVFISDSDARPTGGAHPQAHLWDNGNDVIEALESEMDVRTVALENFDETVIRHGAPMALLEEALVPLYLRHRFQIEAVSKLVGGVSYNYSVRGDGSPPPTPVDPQLQQRAIDALFGLVTPQTLRLPDHISSIIPPRPPGFGQNRELFDGYSGLTFDPYAPAETATSMVFRMMLQPQRTARLVYQKDADASQPGLAGMLSQAMESLFEAPTPDDPTNAELARMVQTNWINHAIALASSRNASPAVKSRTIRHLKDVNNWLKSNGAPDNIEESGHREFLSDEIERFLFRPSDGSIPESNITTPPGSPIGQD